MTKQPEFWSTFSKLSAHPGACRCFAFFILFYFLFTAAGCSLFKPKPAEPEKVSIRDIIKEKGYKITVYFDINSDNLDILSKDSIMRTAKLLAVSNIEAYLTGFADKTGNQDKNVTLSESRVNAVKNFLLSLGVTEDSIYTDYFGDTLPVENADTPEAYAKNRRVEILLTAKMEDAVAANADVSKSAINALTLLKQRRASNEAAEAQRLAAESQNEDEIEAQEAYEIFGIMDELEELPSETQSDADEPETSQIPVQY